MRDQRRDQPVVDTPQAAEAWRTGGDPDARALALVSLLRETFAGSDPEETIVLGQAIAGRLFSVGLDLHFVLGLTTHPAARARLEGTIHELDDVIKDVRRLALRLTEPPDAN